MSFIHKPVPCFLDKCEKYKIENKQQIYRLNNKYFTWDGLHGEIEAFDKFGYHIGVLDAITGDKIKPAVQGRRLNVR